MSPERSGFAKQLALNALARAGLLTLAERMDDSKLRVLTYHRVVPRTAWRGPGRPANTLFVDEFDAQMRYLADNYHVVDAREFKEILVGRRAVPKRAVAITFDDGYQNNFTHAFPVLERYRLHAAFFVTAGLVGDPKASFWFDRLDRVQAATSVEDIYQELGAAGVVARCHESQLRGLFKRLSSMQQDSVLSRLEARLQLPNCAASNPDLYSTMTWNEVRALAKAGMTIGSHTLHHQILAAVDQDTSRTELRASRERIEQEVATECWCFAYPNGQRADFRPEDQQAIVEIGYQCAFTQCYGVVDAFCDRTALPRIPVPDVGDIRILRVHLSGLPQRLGPRRRY